MCIISDCEEHSSEQLRIKNRKRSKIMLGLLAASKAGHDKKQIYVILKETDNYVYLADGINRKVSNLKKKNKKHIQIIKTNRVYEIQSKIADDSITDEFVKNIIKEYCKSKNTIETVNQEV